jgi:hypothetical protein
VNRGRPEYEAGTFTFAASSFILGRAIFQLIARRSLTNTVLALLVYYFSN